MNLTQRQRCFFVTPPLSTPRLRIRGLGIRDELPPCRIDRPRGTGDHLLICAHDPARIGPQGTPLRTGEVVVWAPGMRQCYENDRGLRHSWLHADGEALCELLERGGLPIGRACAPGSTRCSEWALGAIFDELHAPQPEEDIILALLTAWILSLARNQRGTPRPAIPEPIAGIKRLIDTRFGEALSLEGLAQQASMSPQHLTRRFKALVGSSPIAYQLSLRMERAAWLLRDIERRVGSVGEQVGYADPYQFSRAFRRHHGCSPSAWRRRFMP